MADNRKFYWLKLKEDFFDDKYIKALRKLPDGEALVIVYLKMQLKSLKTDGFIQYDRLLPSQEEELALVLDEDVNVVRLALSALLKMKLVENWDNETLYMSAMQSLIGSETATAERVRKHRKKIKLLQCNTEETKCNIEIERRDREKREEIEIGGKEVEKIPPELDNMSSNSLPYKEIVDYLNKKIGSKYKHTAEKTRRCIKARFNEGFTFEDFKKVIDTKVADWKNNPKMQQYLRPETLFGTKFESYLNQPSTAHKVASWYDEYLEKEKEKLARPKEVSSESLEDLEAFFGNKGNL
jgi:uncharacterized phage protein (TIGR02220 family)/predicted phage replisome organizer